MKRVFRVASVVIVMVNLARPNAAPDRQARIPVLLELFTSEGCSSCPPADRLLESLDAEQPFADVELVVLSEHVDYWNASGWTDPYSAPIFSQRQNQYARRFGLPGVYTPELVVDGKWESVGSDIPAAKIAVEKALKNEKAAITLTKVRLDGGEIKLHAELSNVSVDGGRVTLFVALASNKVRSEVLGGENAGRSLTHVAVVNSLLPVTSELSAGKFSKDIRVSLPSSLRTGRGRRVVVFLQSDRSQEIIGVAQARF